MCLQLAEEINLVPAADIEVLRDDSRSVALRWKKTGKRQEGIRISLMFPLTDRESFVQLRDEHGEEIGIIRNLSELDEESRQVVEAEIEKQYFIPSIVRIESIEAQFHGDRWQVITERGPRTFEVAGKRRSIQYVTSDHLIIKDIDGNRYEIKSLRKLDPASRKLLAREL